MGIKNDIKSLPARTGPSGNYQVPAKGTTGFKLGDRDKALPSKPGKVTGPISQLQSDLGTILDKLGRSKGSKVQVDGKYGPNTQAMVRELKRTLFNEVNPTGEIDAAMVRQLAAKVLDGKPLTAPGAAWGPKAKSFQLTPPKLDE
jgi:hypothetical protein